MKKILCCFVFLLGVFFLNSKDALAKEIYYEGSTGVYVKKEYGSYYESANVRKYSKYNTKNYLYSIETYVRNTFDAPYEVLDYKNYHENINERVRVLAYVGDKLFKEKNDASYYGVAQVLIWQTLANEGMIEFNDVSKYENIIKEIESDVNDYLSKPFDGKNIEVGIDEEIVISDELLKFYEIEDINTDLIEYKDEDNKITIKGVKKGTVTFKLKRYLDEKDYSMEVFKNDLYTDYISAGNFYLEDSFTVTVLGGQIKFNISSDDVNNFNVSYGIFDSNNNLVYKLDATNGTYMTSELPFGKYRIKQLNIGEGFLVDENVYEVLINFDNKIAVVDLNSVRNKFKVTINFKNKEGENIKDAIEFKIYDNYNADNGTIDIWLEKGVYSLNLINSTFTLCEDITLEVNKDMVVDINLMNEDDIAIDVPDTFSFNYLYVLLGFGCVKKIIFN